MIADRELFVGETPNVIRGRKRSSSAIWLILFVALIARVPGIFTDAWLDEIWSHGIAVQVHSLRDVFTSNVGRIDNNHPLNTIFLRTIGLDAPTCAYRMPSLLAGIGCVLLVAKRSRFAGWLLALCFPFAFYSSEARGYELAVFFALLAFDALVRNRERSSWSSAITFWCACVLGFLAHLTFVHFYIAAICWSLFWVRRVETLVVRQLARWLALHAIPIAFIVIFYRLFVRHLAIGGASPRSTADVLISAWSMLIGGPEAITMTSRFIACIFACAAITAFITSIVSAAMKRDDRWLFDVLVVFVAPCFLLAYDLILSVRPQPLMVRYFLVAMIFALLAIARGLQRLSRTWRVVAIGIFVIANVFQLIAFLHVGRGGYVRAMDRIVAGSGSTPAVVGGDSDFRVGEVVRFYDARRSPLRQVTYVTELPPRVQAEWFIVSSSETIVDETMYQLDSVYPTSSLSGTTWRVYRKRS